MKPGFVDNRRVSSEPVYNDERYSLYQNEVFKSRSDLDSSSVTDHVFSRNLKTVRISAAVVVITNLFWLAVDIMRGGTMNLISAPALMSITVQILFSVYMIFLPAFDKDTTGRLVRYSFLLYYICIIIGVCVLAIIKNVQMLNAGTNYSLAGIPLSTYYLFMIILAPLPSGRDSMILGGVFIVMLLVPAFLPGRELYSIPQQSIIRLCMAIAYWYVRDMNITLAENMRRMSVYAFTDPLTQVLNRRALDTYIDDIWKNKKAPSVGVLILDIDSFKEYNDHHSHICGDEALYGVCRAAVKALGGKRDFMFRYGGEEFAVIMPGCTDEDIVRCGIRIRDAVYNADIKRSDDNIHQRITVTVGCAREEITDSAKDYISAADKQLYVGKKSGKNCVVFNGEIYR